MSEHAIDVYQDAGQEWRWRIKTENGSILADSGEGYKSKVDCLHGLYGIFFGSFDDSFLVYYAEWQEHKDANPPDLGGAPVAKLELDDAIDDTPIVGGDDGPGQSEG